MTVVYWQMAQFPRRCRGAGFQRRALRFGFLVCSAPGLCVLGDMRVYRGINLCIWVRNEREQVSLKVYCAAIPKNQSHCDAVLKISVLFVFLS